VERMLALADLRIPDAYLAILGSAEEAVIEEALAFFELLQRVLTNPGEHCHAGLDCPACGMFLPHHSPRGVDLLTAIAFSPSLGIELKKGAVRLLVEIALAMGKPPQRQALGSLVQLLQLQRPRSDLVTCELQPYTRKVLCEVLQTPTPALAHAMYCFPAAFPLLGVSRADVSQPKSLDEVSDNAFAWLHRLRESADQRQTRPPNWLTVIPMVAWARHYAQLDAMRSLTRAVEALLQVYQEAFIHAEMPHLPDPTLSGGLPPSTWAGGPVTESESRTAGPARFMVEFMGFVELVFLRFGPGSLSSAVKVLIKEMQDERLVETPWYLQLLHLFGTLTAHRAPWMRAHLEDKERLRFQVAGIEIANHPLHPSSWTLGKWFKELAGMALGRALLFALRAALTCSHVLLRRPKWSVTFVALVRTVWRNILDVSTTLGTKRQPHASGATAADCPDAVVLEIVERGVVRLIFDECIESRWGTPISGVELAGGPPGPERLDRLLDLRNAGITLLEDVVRLGRQHISLVAAIVGQVTRKFLVEQLELFVATAPGIRMSTTRLFRALIGLRSNEIENLFKEMDIYAQLSGTGFGDIDQGGRPEHQSEEAEQLAVDKMDHPLALHRLQIGELIGGFRQEPSMKAPVPATDQPGTATAARQASLPRRRGSVEVVVPRRRQASHGPFRR